MDSQDTFIDWDDKYQTGVDWIDEQHKQLFRLTNTLHSSSLTPDAIRESFTQAMHAAVNYVKSHFAYEEEMLRAVGYPDFTAHRREHVEFMRKILESVKLFESGRTTIALVDFVRFLRDWILGHILVNDMQYARWIRDNNKLAQAEAENVKRT
jgi:hemerythrin-like metal-binding protein